MDVVDLMVDLNSEWLTNQHRDTYASFIGHSSLLAYFAIAENESIGRMKYNFLQVHHQSQYSFLLIWLGLDWDWIGIGWVQYLDFVKQNMVKPCGVSPHKEEEEEEEEEDED